MYETLKYAGYATSDQKWSEQRSPDMQISNWYQVSAGYQVSTYELSSVSDNHAPVYCDIVLNKLVTVSLYQHNTRLPHISMA